MPPLRRVDLALDPIEQFGWWWKQAVGDVPLAGAMALATVDSDGGPDARTVMLRDHGPKGFRFFTDVESASGRQLAGNPRAAMVVHWRELDRQVRVRGRVDVLARADRDQHYLLVPAEIEFWQGHVGRPHDRFLYRRESHGWLIARLAP